MIPATYVLLIGCGFCALYFLYLWFRPYKIDIEEFEKAFPGECIVCSYHSYGIREGHVDPGELPNEHRCPEKWARWKGALHKRSDA